MNKNLIVSLVGLKLYGYCDGFFGTYPQDRILEDYGMDWIVARGIEDSKPYFVGFENSEELLEKVERWSKYNG